MPHRVFVSLCANSDDAAFLAARIIDWFGWDHDPDVNTLPTPGVRLLSDKESHYALGLVFEFEDADLALRFKLSFGGSVPMGPSAS